MSNSLPAPDSEGPESAPGSKARSGATPAAGGGRRHRSPRLLALLSVFVVGSIAAAVFWPEAPCSDPVCARQRFAVAVEIDTFAGAEPPPLEVDTIDGRQSVHAVLASGGIDAQITFDQTDIPYDVSQGRLDRADLYRYFQAWRSLDPPDNPDAKIYALISKAGIAADNGERLFGIMFDFDGREGFAVAPSETAQTFGELEAASISILQMRTFIHELLHTLNRGHLDAAELPGGRLTLEAPTKCISNRTKGAWSLREQPLFALSPSTIRFFQTGTPKQVLPGSAHTPFDLGRASATECEQARTNQVGEPVITRWALWRKRLSWNLLSSASAAEAPADTTPSSDLTVRIQAQPAAYPLGYPVAVRIIASNQGEQPVPLKDRLAPAYGMLRIETRAVDADEWQPFLPLAWFEPASDEAAMLAPGESTEQTIAIYFGDGGWTFAQPGDYEVRARLVLGDESEQVTSAAVPIGIEAPRTDDDNAALEALFGAEHELERDVGRLLSFGGRGGPDEELERIERLVEKYPDTTIATALNLTLASHALRPTLDPLTGVRPPPDVETATRLLADACTDSGVSALKTQLLARHVEPVQVSTRSVSPQTETHAWEGVPRAPAAAVATYSDPQLAPLGASMHFCIDEDHLHGAALKEARRIARLLRKDSATPVIVTGHADYSFSCSYNDALAMRRAEALKRALVAGGVAERRITAVSLGKRRPLDFASTEEAGALNRRAEVLVQRPQEAAEESLDAADVQPRAMPACPTR